MSGSGDEPLECGVADSRADVPAWDDRRCGGFSRSHLHRGSAFGQSYEGWPVKGR